MKVSTLIATAAVAAAASLSAKFVRHNVGANTWNYGNPTLGCAAGEMNVSVTGLPGDFCSPPCSATGACPTSYPPGTGATSQGECVLDTGSGDPTYCALLCVPPNGCGTGATCQPIQGVGVCTYTPGQQ